MKKLAALTTTTLGSLAFPVSVFAQEPISITPNQGIDPENTSVQNVISSVIQIIFVIAILAVLFFLLMGAFQWITSGGDKEKINKARGTIINALIGMAVLGLAFLIVTVVGNLVGLSITNLSLPTLGNTV